MSIVTTGKDGTEQLWDKFTKTAQLVVQCNYLMSCYITSEV